MKRRATRSRRAIAAAAVTGSMVVGGVAGAMIFAPTMGVAQETSSRSEMRDAWSDETREGCGAHLGQVAELIGIDEAELHEALRSGQTIAEVAQENGVDTRSVIDGLVAGAQSRMDEALAEGFLTEEESDQMSASLEQRTTAMVNGERPAGMPPFGRSGHGPHGLTALDGWMDLEA